MPAPHRSVWNHKVYVKLLNKSTTCPQQIECLQQVHDKLYNKSLTNLQQFDNFTTIQVERLESEHDKNSVHSGGKCPKMTKKNFPRQRPLRDSNPISQESSTPVGLLAGEKNGEGRRSRTSWANRTRRSNTNPKQFWLTGSPEIVMYGAPR